MLLTATPYDDKIITHIRSLPERRVRRQTRDWRIPSRRAHLRAACALIGELEERSIDVNDRGTRCGGLSDEVWGGDGITDRPA